MTNYIITILGTFVAFGLFGLAVMLGAFFGKRRTRRCACAASRELMKKYEAREKAKKAALLYSPQNVDPMSLPIVPDELK